jgi:hypothetical protein
MTFLSAELIGEPMNCPKDHKAYQTRVAASQAMVELIADARKTGRGGKSYKRLGVWECNVGPVKHWHVGRRNKLPKSYKPPKPAARQENLPTFSEARRKLAALDRTLERTVDYCVKKRIEIATRLVELDRTAGWIG